MAQYSVWITEELDSWFYNLPNRGRVINNLLREYREQGRDKQEPANITLRTRYPKFDENPNR